MAKIGKVRKPRRKQVLPADCVRMRVSFHFLLHGTKETPKRAIDFRGRRAVQLPDGARYTREQKEQAREASSSTPIVSLSLSPLYLPPFRPFPPAHSKMALRFVCTRNTYEHTGEFKSFPKLRKKGEEKWTRRENAFMGRRKQERLSGEKENHRENEGDAKENARNKLAGST